MSENAGCNNPASHHDQLAYLGCGNLRQRQAFETVWIEILEIPFALDTHLGFLGNSVGQSKSVGTKVQGGTTHGVWTKVRRDKSFSRGKCVVSGQKCKVGKCVGTKVWGGAKV